MPVTKTSKGKIIFFATGRTDSLSIHWDNGRLVRCNKPTLIPHTLNKSLRNQLIQNHAEIIFNIGLRTTKFSCDILCDFRYSTPFPTNLLKERLYIPHNRASARSRTPHQAFILCMANIHS